MAVSAQALACVAAALLAGEGGVAESRSDETSVCIRFIGTSGKAETITALLSTRQTADDQRIHFSKLTEASEYCVAVEELFGTHETVALNLIAPHRSARYLFQKEYRRLLGSYPEAGIVPANSGVLINRGDIQDGVLEVALQPAYELRGAVRLWNGEPFVNTCFAYEGQAASNAWPDGWFSIYLPADEFSNDVIMWQFDIFAPSWVVRIDADAIRNAYDPTTGVSDVGMVVIDEATVSGERDVVLSWQNPKQFTPGNLGSHSIYTFNHDSGAISRGTVHTISDGTVYSEIKMTPGTHSVLVFPTRDVTDKSEALVIIRDVALVITELADIQPWLNPEYPIQFPTVEIPSTEDWPNRVVVEVDYTVGQEATSALAESARNQPK